MSRIVWFATKTTLKCFCSKMHTISWDGEEPPIILCDGREIALLQTEMEKEK